MVFLQESEKLPKGVSKNPIFISIAAENTDYLFNELSGKYNYHSHRNNLPVFVRDGGQVANFTPNPYYLTNYDGLWFIQTLSSFKINEQRGFLKCRTKGLN